MMKRAGMLMIPLLAGMIPGAIAGDEWSISLKPVYRTFEDVEIQGRVLENPVFGTGSFVNGSVNAAGTVATNYTQPAGAPAIGVGSTLQMNTQTVVEADEEPDDAFGGTLSAERLFWHDDKGTFALGVDLGLTYVGTEMDESVTTAGSVTPYTVILDMPPINQAPYQVAAAVGGTVVTAGQVDYDYEIDSYTFHLGLTGKYNFGNFHIDLSTGPTLTYVDGDVSMYETVTFTADDSNVYTPQRHSKSGTDLLFGAYVAVGLNYDLTEAISVGAEYRYDGIFQDFDELDYVEADLSGQSVGLKLTYRF